MFTTLKLPALDRKLTTFVETHCDVIPHAVHCSVGISGGGFVYRVIHCEDEADFQALDQFLLKHGARKLEDRVKQYRFIYLID